MERDLHDHLHDGDLMLYIKAVTGPDMQHAGPSVLGGSVLCPPPEVSSISPMFDICLPRWNRRCEDRGSRTLQPVKPLEAT